MRLRAGPSSAIVAVLVLTPACVGEGGGSAVPSVQPADESWRREIELQAAARNGDDGRLLDQLALGVDPEIRDPRQRTPLMIAARMGRTSTVETLLRWGVEVEAADDDGNTALVLACQGGYLDVVRLLLDAGSKADVRPSNGSTPLEHAAASGNGQLVELLLAQGVDASDGDALGVALEEDHRNVVAILRRAGADLPRTDLTAELENPRERHVPMDDDKRLVEAARRGDVDQVQSLLADDFVHPDARDELGRSALYWATFNGYERIVRVLLDAGADPNLSQPLLEALGGRRNGIALELIRAGANPNVAADSQITALMKAAESCNYPLTLALLDAGADVRARDVKGRTVLDRPRPVCSAVEELLVSRGGRP